MRGKGEMEILQKLASKLFCVEICGRNGERGIGEFMLGHVNFFLNRTSRDKTNFLPLQGIQVVLRKAGCHSPAPLLLRPAALSGPGFSSVSFALWLATR